jgi:hypothetical protein
VQSRACGELLGTNTDASGLSTGDGRTGTTATVWAVNGCAEIFTGGAAAGLATFSGGLEIRQQEPLADGISEACVVDVCRICIIIRQCSPPQWPAVPNLGLQFASAASGVPKSVTVNINATDLKARFISFKIILFRTVIPACEFHHIQR